tara:strand:+ start:6265 stop:6645 length:381 start_codon:yes stop_codon:yes gene_type:complete
MAKCPLCEGSIPIKDVRFRLKTLRLCRPAKVLKTIDDIFEEVSNYWTVNDVAKAGFLADIENVDGDIIVETIRKFKSKGGIQRGFGLRYLSGMIKNESERIAIRKEYDRKNLDRIPPKLKDNNEKY